MYDLTVIGAGWAGFNAALKARELGLKACLIDSGALGGTCLNHGCIPTKALIQSAKLFSRIKKSSEFGIDLDNLRINFGKIQERKNKIIRELALGMQSKLTGVDFIQSSARIISPCEIKIDGRSINTKFILIASGSIPAQLPEFKFDGIKIISSEQALALTEIPPDILIVGGGVIGCEFAGLFSRLGSRVVIAEELPFLLPGQDREVQKKLEAIFKKKGVGVETGANISSFNLRDYSKVLVCVGRSANVSGLGLENLSIRLENNAIAVDDYLKTNIANIYAAGDCTAKIMLAHYASYQGSIAVENMASNNKYKADNSVVPACIFTDPEIASVGLSEENAFAAGLSIEARKFDFRASAMARIIDEPEGFIKAIINRKTQEIIGASIIGPQATELIAIFTFMVSARLKISQIRAMIFAHPTLSESLREAL